MTSLGKRLLSWYASYGRSGLPWRQTRDPYRVLVSECMLQQTQVDRVIAKYESFTARFPDFASLARATRADVLREWKGLGYNSRAIRLKRLAEIVCESFDGALPNDSAQLRILPGVGPYTVAALRAFAFDEDDIALDTNIRRVMHRVFFGIEYPSKANARELDVRAHAAAPRGRAHDWNSALMDLGATICTARAPKCLLCPIATQCAAAPIDPPYLEVLRAKFAAKRSPQESIPFEQSTRFARGRIVDRLRELPAGTRISFLDLHRDLCAILPPHALGGMENTLEALERDGIVRRDGESVALSD